MTIEQRLEKIEACVSSLAQSIEGLEHRIRRIEQLDFSTLEAVPTYRGDLTTQDESHSLEETSTKVLPLLGRSFLVLAGAFVLRTLTDSGTLNQQLGVAIGLLYAFTWIIFSDRLGAKNSKADATFHGCTAIIICYPMILETTVKLQIISPVVSCIILSIVTGIALLISWKRDLRILAIAFTLAAVATSLPILISTGAIQAYCVFIILLGGMTIWFRHTKKWNVMCWFVAFIADFLVLTLISLASDPAHLSSRFSHVTVQGAQIIAIGLLFVYLGAFVIRTILFRSPVRIFTILQSLLVLLVGLGGAIQISPQTGGLSQMTLGVSAIIVSLVFYYLSSLFLARQNSESRNYYYFIWLGQILFFLGSWFTLGKTGLDIVWCILAIVTAYLGGHFARFSLRLQSAFFATAAYFHVDSFQSWYDSFTNLSEYPWGLKNTLGLIVLFFLIITYIVLIRTQKTRKVKPWKNTIRFILLFYCLSGIAMIFVATLIRIFGKGLDTNPALVALIRTAVLACSAIIMAYLGKRKWYAELEWMVYPVLVVGAIKLLMEDLPLGNPGLLSLSFIFYGVALIFVPRLLKRKSDFVESETS